MRLGAKQELFARLLPRLLDKAHELGFEVRVGEVYRTEAQAEWNADHCRKCQLERSAFVHHPNGGGVKHTFVAIGIRDSLHRKKLAVDLMLFKDGEWLKESEDYTELGVWWEQQNELARWGGRFSNPDGGHFSLHHRGVS